MWQQYFVVDPAVAVPQNHKQCCLFAFDFPRLFREHQSPLSMPFRVATSSSSSLAGNDPPPPSSPNSSSDKNNNKKNIMSARLTNRGKKTATSSSQTVDNNYDAGDDSATTKKASSSSNGITTNLVLIVLVSVGIAVGILYSLNDGSAASLSLNSKQGGGIRSKRSSSSSSKGERFVIDEKLGIDLHVDLIQSPSESSSKSSFAHGPHSVTLVLNSKRKLPTGCSSSDLKFWLQYEGDAMGTAILMQAADDDDSIEWKGAFSFPISGSYQLVSYYVGCNDTGDGKVTRSILKEGLDVVVNNRNINNDSIGSTNSNPSAAADPYLTENLYPKAAWIASPKVDTNLDKASLPYIWHDPSVSEAPQIIPAGTTSVSKQGAVFTNSGFFAFPKLSNYELVCWVGSNSAANLREAFLQERTSIAAGQRPFKFHHYNTTSFVRPVEAWPENEEQRFRKCKHILVSMDEIQPNPSTGKPLTQQEYADHVTTFLHHIENAFQDETFPIWIFTNSESPISPTSCTPPYYLPRSSHHPCNDVLLFDLFNPYKEKKFSNRVHLLDNTMISLPQSLLQPSGNSKSVVVATIALRIFVLVGKKVEEWRAAGQVGQVDGLHRRRDGKDIIEPNFELVPYNDWKK